MNSGATTIPESGMTFGPFLSDQCFHIEASRTYTSLGKGIKIAEFLLLRPLPKKGPMLLVVEAKSSSPRPKNSKAFDDFIAELREKLVNGFSLGWASCLGRHDAAVKELPASFKSLDLGTLRVRFVVVINGHREEWLPPLQDALAQALKCTIKTWGFSPPAVIVLNEQLAKKRGLIS